MEGNTGIFLKHHGQVLSTLINKIYVYIRLHVVTGFYLKKNNLSNLTKNIFFKFLYIFVC